MSYVDFDSVLDATVLIFPEKHPSIRRSRGELEGPFFLEHFPIRIPFYAIEYTQE